MIDRREQSSCWLIERLGRGRVLCLMLTSVLTCLLDAGTAGAQAPQAGLAVQGVSRTVTMQQLCGACIAQKFATCGKSIEGPTFDDQGNLYIVNMAEGAIDKITPDAKCSQFASTGGIPQGLKFHNGMLYGVDRKRGVITVDLKTAEVKSILPDFYGENFIGLNDLIVDQVGGIYFTDAWGSSVLNPRGAVYYLSSDHQVSRLVSNMAYPNGISLSPDNRTLYIDEFMAQRVIAVPVAAPGHLNIGFAHVMGYLAGGWGPDSMAVDARGNVYCAHWGAREVVVFDPDDFIIGTINLPPDAGPMTNNVAFNHGYVYITEGRKAEIWRVKMNVEGAKLN
jgi:gluconolactonase